jgi:peptidoglycan/LPS O-acetylase OafA/YrhL
MFHLAFTYCAWQDGRTGSIPLWALLVLCLCAVVSPDFSPVLPLRVGEAALLALPFFMTAGRNVTGPADTSAAFSLGLRYGVSTGAVCIAGGAILTLLGALSTQWMVPVKNSTGTGTDTGRKVPFFPGLLAATVLVAPAWPEGSPL